MANIEATADWSSLGVPTRPAAPLHQPIRELAGCWLTSRCPNCERPSYLPLRMMGNRLPTGTVLGGLLARLRCEKCATRPKLVGLVPDAAQGTSGAGDVAPWFWRVEFHLDDEGRVKA